MASTRIDAPLYGGLFHADNGAQVPFVLPGEQVEVSPLRIVQASPQRVAPGCLHFGVCGGCHYQHAEYACQLEMKAGILDGLLRAAGVMDRPAIVTHAAEPWQYRNRIRLRVEPGVDGGIELGYSRRASNDFLPITMCPIAAPLLLRAARQVQTLAAETMQAQRLLESVAELELFCTADESRLQARFYLRNSEFVRNEPGAFTAFCVALQSDIGELFSGSATIDPDLGRRERRTWAGAHWGAEGLGYPAAGRAYWVPQGAFFQVNRFLIDRLVGLVVEGQQGALAWDLFAGVGLFSRALAESFGQVVAVEGGDSAARALSGLSRSRTNIEAVHSATLDFLRQRRHQRERPELIVADPPRAGLGVEAAQLLEELGSARMVYVSCDPVTLARDLAVLTRTAYQVAGLDLVDLFPQTFHLETVVRLERRAG